MDKVTQQNAAAAEESASAAAELNAHANEITGVVGHLLRGVGGKRENDPLGVPGESLEGGRRRADPAPDPLRPVARAGLHRTSRLPATVGSEIGDSN